MKTINKLYSLRKEMGAELPIDTGHADRQRSYKRNNLSYKRE